MTRIQRDASNPDYIVYSLGDAKVYLSKNQPDNIWFEGWDAFEITKAYDLLLLIQMLNTVNQENQGVNVEGSL